ncbi:hypothetical protein [Cellulomonas palmilytica]|uniref:hypothetical protein n=1 Tax=Cellulomonas palmilytica TaxID=2608402 RepID=UPI001F352498|nr:hypothetical protein [Cellulomonas palmilytica]UJP41098.1 hypothetical protein F1D97_06505 [Cellulomonas palmilytica]
MTRGEADRRAADLRNLRRAAYLQRRALASLPLDQRVTLALRGAGTRTRPPVRTTA